MTDTRSTPGCDPNNGGSELPANEKLRDGVRQTVHQSAQVQSTGAPTIPTPVAFEEMGDINGALKNVLLLQAQYARGSEGITRQMRDVACESLAHEIQRYIEARTPRSESARTIDSAPKDQDGILAFSPSFYQGKGGWVAAVWHKDGWHSNPGGWRFEPTHWMPFPSAPLPHQERE